MDDTGLVGGGEAVGDLAAEADDLARGQRRAEALAEALALDQLHDQERVAVLVADVVDGDEIGVAQRRGRPRLLLEAREQIPAPIRLTRRSGLPGALIDGRSS